MTDNTAEVQKLYDQISGQAEPQLTPWAQAHPNWAQFILQALRYAPLGLKAGGVSSVPGGAPRQSTGIALSRNKYPPAQPGEKQDFAYDIYRDAIPIGSGQGQVTGPNAWINWMGARQGGGTYAPNTLSISDVRELMRQLKGDFPQASQISGARSGGAYVADPIQTLSLDKSKNQ